MANRKHVRDNQILEDVYDDPNHRIKVGLVDGDGGNQIDDSNPLPVYLSQGGTQFFDSFSGSSDPGNEQELISVTVPAATARDLSQVVISCRAEGAFTIKAGSAIIGSGRTGAARPSAVFRWDPRMTIAAGETIKVLFKARSGSAVNQLEAYLHAADRSV